MKSDDTLDFYFDKYTSNIKINLNCFIKIILKVNTI